MKLTILGLSEARATKVKFTHIISVLELKYHSLIPDLGIPPQRRLLLSCEDTSNAEIDYDNASPPTKRLVAQGLAFAKKMPTDANLLVHCFAGVSRSVAMAYAILCQAHPSQSEKSLLAQVVRQRGAILPNSLIVAYGDELLKRHGAMSEAVDDYHMKRR